MIDERRVTLTGGAPLSCIIIKKVLSSGGKGELLVVVLPAVIIGHSEVDVDAAV